ncbi:uncharacterized protein PITG_01340 [Phytophthora infestans T30-4]|uniref:Uncharacterized protein n=1 Tax=Phytophthora infestans (strain T30-4) TaxID=403677 RepID=D0MV97_PHYIT|nr:uncharacterized protein PITG_01340 [Phytophthora infestans T30-4]EEY61093.1 conserved hypothetical protein [Phytophthora infestans T30-4]|eukprot:XP_002908010.1 conserved hypothetical protein [Phytophthora infestans T30-4]
MAVHSAAISGLQDIVRIILEADNMIDLNTPTFDTKETLAHLAVKHGHRDLYRMLAGLGADLRIKDRTGKRVCDMTTDRAWANDIERSTATLERSHARTEGAKNRDAQFRHEGSLRKKGKAKEIAPNVSVASPAATEATSEEVSNLLKDLLVSTGSEVDTSDDSTPITLLEDSIENTAAMFARLRDPNISTDGKVDDAQKACTAIETLEQAKLHRIDHAAISAPALETVRKQCDTTFAFTKFVVGAAHLCVSVNKKAQARELLDVLERRLVKMPYGKREPGGFRELVQTYSAAREAMGMGRTSSPDMFHTLEWYLIYAFDDFEQAIDARPELDGVACFGKRAKHVVYGGTSEEDVARVRELFVFSAAGIVRDAAAA